MLDSKRGFLMKAANFRYSITSWRGIHNSKFLYPFAGENTQQKVAVEKLNTHNSKLIHWYIGTLVIRHLCLFPNKFPAE